MRDYERKMRAFRAQARAHPHHWYDELWEGVKQVGSVLEKAAPFLPLVLKKGGKINRTGVYQLHKGERVLSSAQTKAYNKAMKAKKRPKKTTKKRTAGRRKKKR